MTEEKEDSLFARFGPQFMVDPYPIYEMLRGGGSAVWVPEVFGVGAWMVTGHAECAAALKNKQLDNRPPDAGPLEPLMFMRGVPAHMRLRGLVSRALTPRTVERLRPHVAEIANQLLDAVEPNGAADLIAAYAVPLPIAVITEMLGIPPEDRDRFKAWATVLAFELKPTTMDELRQVSSVIPEINDYLREVIEDRRKTPRADLISDLLQAQDAREPLTIDELIATCRFLLVAGHVVPIGLIGNGVLALLENPDQRAALADPALLPGAIDEIHRYDSPIQVAVRFATEDTAVGSHTAKRGDMVRILLGGANRDPGVFGAPATLDIRRANAQRHLASGGGIHFCLGVPLVRVEAEIAFSTVLRRFPKLALADKPPEWRPHMALRRLEALSVTF